MASENNSERKGFTMTWIIDNFKYFTYGEYVESPTFIVDTMEETKWCLYIYPRFDDDGVDVGLFLGLKRMSDRKGPYTLK
ncbi:hypothetical protein CEXT_143131 [Caerostris extrusa]|uniref:MATH domain-containing protein n=1 Tax=Caerostris extrusa TaxID=172846 RepID=A0AAV4MAN6_CAEEX|nr:hypothetical protein CEXT_143131 [Caerostris extrusa]